MGSHNLRKILRPDRVVDRTRSTILLGILVAVVAAFFWNVLVGDRVLVTCNTSRWLPWAEYAAPGDLDDPTYRSDAARTYLPRRVYARENLTSGRFPLWNPYILGGSPFFADPQSGVLYPTSFVLLPADAARAMGYDVAIHFLAAMLGMFLFLGAIGANNTGRMLGAFAYGLSSFLFLRMGHPTFVAAAAWVPYFFFAYERSRRSFRSGSLLLAAFLSLGYLAGMPQILILGVAALLVYALLDSIEALARGDRKGALRNAKVVCLASVIGLLAVSVQLIPFVEFIKNSRGLGFTFEAMSRDHIWPPAFLLRTVVPDLFGNPVEGTSWTGLLKGVVHPYNSGFMVYCGVGGLSLALASLVFLRRSRHARALFVLLALSLAAGTSTVFLRVIYRVLPLVVYSQIDRVSVIACFALAALAGKGLSMAAGSDDPKVRRNFILVPLGLAALMACGFTYFALNGSALVSGLSRQVALLGAETWFRMSGFRLVEWVREGGRQWFEYELGHIGLGLLFAGTSAVWIGLYVGCKNSPRLRNVAGWLLGLTLLFDLGLAAGRYYVDQPATCLEKTEGIEYLSEIVGDRGTWRISEMGPSGQVLPANTAQIFGIPDFGGLNALYPTGYVGRVAFAAHLRQAGHPLPVALGPVGEMMCVRYLVTDRPYPELTDSPIMRAMVDDRELRSRLGIVDVGGDRRFSLLLAPGEACSLKVTVPECEYLGFSLGLQGDAAGLGGALPGAVVVVGGRGGDVALRTGPLAEGRWHDQRLDISESTGGPVQLIFRVPGAAPDPGLVVAWSRFEFVKRDCEVTEKAGGYQVDAGEADGALALTVASSDPLGRLRVGIAGPSDAHVPRFVGFVRPGGPGYVLVGAGNYGKKTEVLSEEDFELLRARVIHTDGSPLGLSPVYDGDILVYENCSAMPKGMCVDGSLFSGVGKTDPETGVLEIGELFDRLASHVCGRTSILSYEAQRVVAEISADKDCILLLQDTWYPGWRAWLDGVRAPIYRTDLGIRAVPVDQGDHELVMEYAPGSFRLGLILSVVGILLGVAYGAKAKRR
jgi:hypothetical protein